MATCTGACHRGEETYVPRRHTRSVRQDGIRQRTVLGKIICKPEPGPRRWHEREAGPTVCRDHKRPEPIAWSLLPGLSIQCRLTHQPQEKQEWPATRSPPETTSTGEQRREDWMPHWRWKPSQPRPGLLAEFARSANQAHGTEVLPAPRCSRTVTNSAALRFCGSNRNTLWNCSRASVSRPCRASVIPRFR